MVNQSILFDIEFLMGLLTRFYNKVMTFMPFVIVEDFL
jgi:hypothetical protein